MSQWFELIIEERVTEAVNSSDLGLRWDGGGPVLAYEVKYRQTENGVLVCWRDSEGQKYHAEFSSPQHILVRPIPLSSTESALMDGGGKDPIIINPGHGGIVPPS